MLKYSCMFLVKTNFSFSRSQSKGGNPTSKCDSLGPKASNFKTKGKRSNNQFSSDLHMCYAMVPKNIAPMFAELLLKPLLSIIHIARRLRQTLLKWINTKISPCRFLIFKRHPLPWIRLFVKTWANVG